MRERWPSPVGEGHPARRAGVLPGGATLVEGSAGTERAWVLIDDGSVAGLGAALAWSLRADVAADRLEVLVETAGAAGAAGAIARRATAFAPAPRVWAVSGRSVAPAPAVPIVPADSAGSLPPAVAAFRSLLQAHGADPVVEHGVLRGEVLGLEVARVVPAGDSGGWRLAVGVGALDREARAGLLPDQDPGAALDHVVALIRARRRPGAAHHPANALARSRWLRSVVVARPSLVGADHLAAVGAPVPQTDLRRPAAAGAVGRAGGRAVVVVCSTGVDPDLVPTAADVRLAAGARGARLVLVVPEADDYPVTRALAAKLRHPAELITVPADWPALLRDAGAPGPQW